MTRIIIADDHAIVRTGIRQIVARAGDMNVVAEADNGHQLLEQLRNIESDIVLLDMAMPGPNGVELIARIKRTWNALPVLVLSMHNEGQIAARALRAGAAGYICKDSEPDLLIAAIRKIMKGGRYIDPALVDKVLFDVSLNPDKPAHSTLSNRELQIFRLLTEGLSSTEISERLALSIKTVSTYKTRIMEKLDVDNIVGLVRYAASHGLIED